MSKTQQKGFTLVELLVVIGIIAALAAVVIPNVSKFVGSGDTEANNTEAQTVQAAVDLIIADRGLTTGSSGTLNDNSTATNDFSSFDFDTGTTGNQTLYPDYLRQNPTKCSYTWNDEGQVTQASGC